MNITEDLERAIGTGPPLPAPAARLAAGKSAVRRRQLAGGAAAVALIGILGATTGTADLLDRDRKSDPDQFVVVPDPDLPIDPDALQPGQPVGYDEDGRLVRRGPGIEVTRMIEDPVDLDGAENAMLEATYGGMTQWIHVFETPDGGSHYYRDDDLVFWGSFQEWATEAARDGDSPERDWDGDGRPPAWYAYGRVHLDAGSKLLKQVEDAFGPGEDTFALVVERAGVTYWMLVGTGAPTVLPAAEAAHPTFEMWLADEVAVRTNREPLALVRFDTNGRLVGREGVTVVRQLPNSEIPPVLVVEVGYNLAAAAEVRYQGRTWFVLARRTDGVEPEYLPAVEKPNRATLTEFLDGLADKQRAALVEP